MNENAIIYVSISLFDRPHTFIWNPVQAVHEHENCYRIIEKNSDPEHEYWQFSFNEVVFCKQNEFAPNEFGLVAREICTHAELHTMIE